MFRSYRNIGRPHGACLRRPRPAPLPLNGLRSKDEAMAEKPVVEPPPVSNGELTQRSLMLRVRQQEILAELGVTALQGAGFDALLNRTAVLAAEGMQAEFSKVMEYLPGEKRLLV